MVLCILYLAVVGAADAQELAKATFAGGCFWCMEPPFDELADVISTTSGDTGGRSANPTYKEVSAGRLSRSCTTPAGSPIRSCWRSSGATTIP
jgi:peptide-methionine (S)-S-oxide reductase